MTPGITARPPLTSWPTRLYSAYIFDLDGTIYLGNQLLPGAERLVQELRRRAIPVRFLSNNPTKNPAQYAEKLGALGLPTPVEDIANTVVTTVRWLKRHHPDAVVFPIADPAMVDALQDAGIRTSTDPTVIDIVLASYDHGFDYSKLQIAFDAIWYEKRAILVATNPDRFCPFPGGRGEPDCAAVVAAIEACTGTRCVETIGKPNPIMLREALGDSGIPTGDMIMVGDRLSTDIAMATRTGMDSAMPLTGESTLEEALLLPEHEQPRYVLDRVDRLIPQSIWAELGWDEER